MTYKFPIGARKAGVMLALVLMGVSGVLAQSGVSVTVNLADVKLANGTTLGTETGANAIVTAHAGGATADGSDIFGRWVGTGATPLTVTAEFNWRAANSTVTPAITAGYTDTLFIKSTGGTAGADTIRITGLLPRTLTRVRQINFNGAKEVILWDGGDVLGGTGDTAKAINEFLTFKKGTDNPALSGAVRIQILSGTIEASAKTILADVDSPFGDALKAATLPSPAKNAFGAIGSAAAGSRSITLKAHGKYALTGAAGASFALNPAGSGKYVIESDSFAVKSEGLLQIGSPLAGVGGTLTITAWKNATNAANAATAGAAVEAASIDVVGLGNSGTSKNIIVNTKGKALFATAGAIKAEEAEFQHAAFAGTVGAVVFSSANATITLKKVNVTNGTTSGNVPGKIADAATGIDIFEGKFYPSGDSKGTALSSKGSVSVVGASISSAGSATSSGGYVVAGETVNIQSSSSAEAVIAWKGSVAAGIQVGGVYASQGVNVSTDNLYKVEVSVTGPGVGIDVWPDQIAPAVGKVNISGSPGNSAFITVATGQALVVSNSGDKAKNWEVDLYNTVIKRSGTSAATPLISLEGVVTDIEGTSLERTNISAGSNIAVVSVKNTAIPGGSTITDDGLVKVGGGSISGVTGGITASSIRVWRGVYGNESDRNVKIETSTGVTLNALGDNLKKEGYVTINNGNAVILNNNGVASTSTVPSAAVFSLKSWVHVVNVDSIRAGGQAVGILTLNPHTGTVGTAGFIRGGTVGVFSGRVKAVGGFAISAAANVTVDLVKSKNDATGSTALPDSVQPIEGTEKYAYEDIGAKRGNIVVSTAAGNATTSAIFSDGGKVAIGKAEVSATANGGATAVWTKRGEVTVDHEDALVTSASGTGIKVENERVNVWKGAVASNPATGKFAAIWVNDGDVRVGDNLASLAPGLYTNETKKYSRISSNGSLAIYADGAGKYTVTVGQWGILTVAGSGADAGGIQALKDIDVVFQGRYAASGSKSKAFAIKTEKGDVNIGGNYRDTAATITSDEGVAVTTVGGQIKVRSNSTITGNAGVLLYAKDTTNVRSGVVQIGSAGANYINIYNKFGIAIQAVDTVYVSGRSNGQLRSVASDWDRDTVSSRVVIKTDTSTAIKTGKGDNYAGAVYLQGGRVWAGGAYLKSNPIAINSKRVYLDGGVVEANTEKTNVDNEETYTDSKATGIYISKKGSGGKLEIKSGKIIAHGKSTGIYNEDTSVTVSINADSVFARRVWKIGNGHMSKKGAATVSIAAGNNGVAIKSEGAVSIYGNELLDTTKSKFKGSDSLTGLLAVPVYIGAGNRESARAIWMPDSIGILRKTLWLDRAFVEAGSDGAIAVEGGKNTLTRIDHSVVLVRHASTGVKGEGGVFVNTGYVEVLATENVYKGTAITGKGIRIDGGRGLKERSEVHSKDVALFDSRTTLAAGDTIVVQVTSEVNVSGIVRSHLDVGSSVIGDTAHLTMGSVSSERKFYLSTVSDLTKIVEEGKKLTIPSGVKFFVADNGSTLETEASDTVRVLGLVSTVGKQAGARFVNFGKVIVDSTGNVTFNKADNKSFYNEATGTIVLRAGSKLDDSLLVHDTGVYITQNDYTFLKWASVLTGNGTAFTHHIDRVDRGVDGSKAIVPPVFAVLYGDQGRFVDGEDRYDAGGRPFWDANSARVDTVYGTPVWVVHTIYVRYKDYVDTANTTHTLGYVKGTGIVRVDEEGTAYLTEAGTFTRTAIAKNEAGEGKKDYTHVVLPVDVKKLADRQLNEPIFFDGFLYNKDGRVLNHDEDTVLVRANTDVAVKYTSKPAKLLDGVVGAASDQKDITTDQTVVYSGLGGEQFWYKGVGGTYFPLTTNIPTKRGTYEVWTSFQTGRNFEAVPGTENGVVYLGQVEIAAGDWSSVLDKKDSIVYEVFVELQADSAQTDRVAALPYLGGYSAKYDTSAIVLSGVEAALQAGYRITSNDNAETARLTFGVNRATQPGDFVELEIPVVNNSEDLVNQNLRDGLVVRVHVAFLTAAEMKEPKPSYIVVDYRTEKLSGLIVGTTYSISGTTLVATSTDTAIQTAWRDDANGKTISIVALSAVGSYKNASDTATLTIGKKIVTDSVLDGVHADSASNATALDGRLRNTKATMEYRLLPETTWRPASEEATENLKAGTYEIRYAPTVNSFASAAVTRTISAKVVSVAEGSREIPKANVTAEGAVAPVKVAASLFKAGPSPVSKSQGEINFFSSKTVKTGTLYIFDANGKTVAKAKASGTGKIAGAKVGKMAEGTYVVKGVLVGKDGTKDKVSTVFSVVK